MTDYNLTIDVDFMHLGAIYPIDEHYYEVAFTYDPKKHSFFDFMDKTHPASNYAIGKPIGFVWKDKTYTSEIVYIAKMKGTTRVFANNFTLYNEKKDRFIVIDKEHKPCHLSIVNPDGSLKPAEVIFSKE